VSKNKALRSNTVLSIAGFDGTGGAGINVDIKVYSFLNVPHVTIATSLVIQTPFKVTRIITFDINTIKEQFNCLGTTFQFKVTNIGLGPVKEILEFLTVAQNKGKIIFDPLFASGSGQYIFKTVLEINSFLPLLKHIYLLTPNIPEANILAEMEIRSLSEMKEAALIIQEKFQTANILIKGGHLGKTFTSDLLLEGKDFHTFSSRMTDFNIHGTGSFLNAAITAFTFKGEPLVSAIQSAKDLLKQAIQKTDKNLPVLNL